MISHYVFIYYTKLYDVSAPVVVPVGIGLQNTQYTVSDTADYAFVCAKVQSGSVAGRDIMILYAVMIFGTNSNIFITNVYIILMDFLHCRFFCCSEWYIGVH